MKLVDRPRVYLVAMTVLSDGLDSYLEAIGDPAWRGSGNDGQTLIEAAGRMCYRSWQPWDPKKPECSNPNVTKVRESQDGYIANVVKSGHGSVLEHVNVTFIFRDVSRVFTHELVRHRAGMAFSQESLRYVRLDDLRFWIPDSVPRDVRVDGELKEHGGRAFFRAVVENLEAAQSSLFAMFDIDAIKSFAVKKKLTSMFRRLAPIGLATTIMATGNLRAWRHIIAMRTAPDAEEEARLVIREVALQLRTLYPAVFADMTKHEDGSFTFGTKKV